MIIYKHSQKVVFHSLQKNSELTYNLLHEMLAETIICVMRIVYKCKVLIVIVQMCKMSPASNICFIVIWYAIYTSWIIVLITVCIIFTFTKKEKFESMTFKRSKTPRGIPFETCVLTFKCEDFLLHDWSVRFDVLICCLY